jgi:cold shock CspA family protein
MTGIVKVYDSKEFIGTIEDAEGKLHLVKRNSMRRDTILREGLRVSFVSVNLSDGANAQQIGPCQEDI